jgi:hypothetical protein
MDEALNRYERVDKFIRSFTRDSCKEKKHLGGPSINGRMPKEIGFESVNWIQLPHNGV